MTRYHTNKTSIETAAAAENRRTKRGRLPKQPAEWAQGGTRAAPSLASHPTRSAGLVGWALAVAVLFGLTLADVRGDTIHVPRDYPTIQAGIDAAKDGDTVLVADGVYTGEGNHNLSFNGKAITVRSENGPDNCIIDCEREGWSRGFYLQSCDTESVVKGFTITRANSSGIYCCDSSPTITNCTITGNTAGYYGGGIYCYNSDPTITDCTITGNTAGYYGGGIYCYRSDPTITNCAITENTAHFGGGIYCYYNTSPTIINCTITGNTASRGGGIYCYYNTSPTIVNCTIDGNTAEYEGGGIYCHSESNPTITNCRIMGNTASRGGSIYCFRHSDTTITDCTITENTAEYGGGIYCSVSYSTITNCRITGNTASRGGGGIYCFCRSDLTITNCTITGNTAVDGGGGIYCYDNSDPTITNCILWDDTPDEICVDSSNPVVTYSDVQGGWPGEGNIDADPLWVTGPLGDYYLSQQQCGQPEDSPCLDAGKGRAKKHGLKRKFTTCTGGMKDKKKVDMGYHYPRK